MAAPPVQPACGVAGRVRALEGGGEQAPDLRDGQRDHPGSRRSLDRVGRGLGMCGRAAAAVTAQMARTAMTSTMWRVIAV